MNELLKKQYDKLQNKPKLKKYDYYTIMYLSNDTGLRNKVTWAEIYRDTGWRPDE